jgi:tRNA pseudouridine55 synthase
MHLEWLARFHGFLLVDKPEGITSQDVVTRLQRILIERSKPNPDAAPSLRKRDLPKMGHGGTLDPFATGLLVLAVGDGTKLARYLLDSEKMYEATVAFGARTASGDLTNEVVERTDRLPPSIEELRGAAQTFLGKPYLQTPPMYSAKKVDGKPLYELARKGVEIAREPVSCTVHEFEVILGEGAPISTSVVRTRVSGGTYIRTLAEDWAAKLGSLAHLTALRRRASGPFGVERALTLEDLAELPDWTAASAFIPFDACLREKLPSVDVDAEEARMILEGKKGVVDAIAARLPVDAPRTAIYDEKGLRAVFVMRDDGATGKDRSHWDFERVFPRR